MPDGPRPNGPRYGDGLYAWTQYQAELLRSMRTHDDRVDLEDLEDGEEIGVFDAF